MFLNEQEQGAIGQRTCRRLCFGSGAERMKPAWVQTLETGRSGSDPHRAALLVAHSTCELQKQTAALRGGGGQHAKGERSRPRRLSAWSTGRPYVPS
jgi:hypothetical protein